MMYASYRPGRSIAAVPAVLFMTSMATFVQSFVILKLLLLVVFLLASIVDLTLTRRVLLYPRLMWFYLWMCVVGIVWAIVGLLNQGSYVVAVFEGLRLYVIWSVAFLVLFSLLRSDPSLRLFHSSMIASGILICVINFLGVADQLGGWGLVPETIRQSLQLYMGIHDGYVQITSNNIGSLFVVVPYLVSLQFRTDAGKANSVLAKVSLVLCLILVAVSGRRALWLIVALTPCTVLLLTTVTKSKTLVSTGGKRFLAAYCVVAVVTLVTAWVMPARVQEIGYVRHLTDAFSVRDERSIQKGYLIAGFEESPMLGSGLGASAGYSRSEERPWTYELTYHQLLFNIGIVGLAGLGGLFAVYFAMVTNLLRKFSDGAAIPFGLLVAFSSLLLGSYSNPYLRSFDFLFFVGLLPYLSTFRFGFNDREPVVGAHA